MHEETGALAVTLHLPPHYSTHSRKLYSRLLNRLRQYKLHSNGNGYGEDDSGILRDAKKV